MPPPPSGNFQVNMVTIEEEGVQNQDLQSLVVTWSGKKTIVDEELLLEDKELGTLFEPLSKDLLPLLEFGETLQKATGGM